MRKYGQYLIIDCSGEREVYHWREGVKLILSLYKYYDQQQNSSLLFIDGSAP